MSKAGDGHARAAALEAATEPVPVRGLFETHLTVSELARSLVFYRDVVGLPLALELQERNAAFLWIGEPGQAMLGLWSLGSAPVGLSLHVAFDTALEDVLSACERLRSLGVTPLSFFATETTEPSVIGWMPAAAVYFRDPDGHLLEYLAMLDSAPDPEAGVLAWSQWATRPKRVGSDSTCAPAGRDTVCPRRAQLPSPAAGDSVAQLDAYRHAKHRGHASVMRGSFLVR